MPRLEEIHANLIDRLDEAKDQGWLGEAAAIETTLAAATQKLKAMCELAARSPPSTSACPTCGARLEDQTHLLEGPPSPAPGGHDGHRPVAPRKDWPSA